MIDNPKERIGRKYSRKYGGQHGCPAEIQDPAENNQRKDFRGHIDLLPAALEVGVVHVTDHQISRHGDSGGIEQAK